MWFGSGIKKDNQGFLNIVKSIIEEGKKNQENKFYNKKRAIDQIKQQDFDMLKNEDILEDENYMGNSFGESDKNDQNLWFFINNFEWTEKSKNVKLVSESDKIKMIIIPIAIILIFTLVTIFSSVGDGDIKIDLNKTFIWYWNSNIV